MIGLTSAVHRYIAKFNNDVNDVGVEAGGAITHSFINSTHHDILVVDRNNEAILVERAQPGTDMSEPGLTIKMHRYHASRKSGSSAAHYTRLMGTTLGGMNEIHNDTLNILSKNMVTASGTLSICRRFFVPLKEIENHTTVFEQKTGLVLSIDGSCASILHPESEEFRMSNQNASFLENQPVGRLYEIVDNHRQHKERFVYIGNEVLRVPYTLDRERADGLYITEVESRGGVRSVSKTTRYDFEEGYKKFGLFITKEEAETSGNPGLNQQRLIEELKSRLAVRQAEEAVTSVDRKSEQEREAQDLRSAESLSKLQENAYMVELRRHAEEQKQITEEARERTKRDDIRREAEYASYSSSLKSTSDTIKFVPAIIAGVAALCGGIMIFSRK